MLYCWSIIEPPGRKVEYSTQKEEHYAAIF